VAASLRTVPGVRSATASRASSSAVVVREKGRATDRSLIDTVSRAGYGARVVRVVP
jgi:copper chaperone CopZ